MKFTHVSVYNMDNAIRGMRNPMNSWDRNDSYVDEGVFIFGEQDLKLATSLIKAGTEHRKFLRQIVVSVDITAPLYWWKEFDTYKVGTVANSTSTMHKLSAAPITWDMFEFGQDFHQDVDEKNRALVLRVWEDLLYDLERLRKLYIQTGDKFFWKELVRLLPSGWLQTRTVTLNYENLLSMYGHRNKHKLTEWHDFCDWIQTLPYTQTLFDI